jgi:DNA ligase (NAD+)
MDYCMDGVVIKVNDLSWQEKLGYSQKVPYWAKAFKFKQESASTKLLNVEWFVGRSGKLTPVGILDTVSVDGSNISNVTLNNMNYINSLDIRIGSYVFIEKGGAVIPKVTGIDYERHILENYDFEACKKIEEPLVCPVCGQPVVKKENVDGNEGIHLYCLNKDCEAKVIARLEYFVSKDCMDIDGLGTSTLVSLYEFNNVRNWFDLYTLKEADFTYLGKNGQKVYENIQKSKDMPADRVLTALGIPMIGKVAAKALLECYGSIKDIYTDITDYHGDKLFAEKPIGTAASNELVAFVLDSDNEKLFANLFELLNCTYISNKPVGGPLEGKTLLATGTLENFPREEIKDSIINNGGKYASSVSKKLDYLIIGSKPGASKVAKATELGIKMISESEYLDLIK